MSFPHNTFLRHLGVIALSVATTLAFTPAAQAAADTTAPTVPGTPTFSQVTPFTVTITWRPSTDNVGITNYMVRRTLPYGGDWNESIPGTANTITIRDLTPNNNYTFAIIAGDAAGNSSAPTPLAQVRTLPYTAGPMCSVSYQPLSTGSGTFFSQVNMTNLTTGPWQEWTLAFSLAPGQRINPEWGFTQNGSRWSTTFVWLWTSGAGPLRPGATRSVSFAGTFTGTITAPTEFTINDQPCTVTGLPTPPGPPVNLTASTVTPGSVSLVWGAATPGSSPIRFYEVLVNGIRFTCTGVNPLACLVSPLNPGTSYIFSVRAVDTTGLVGPASTIIVQTPGATPPSPPSQLRVSAVTATSVTLSWAASTPGSAPLAGYIIYRLDGTTETAISVSPTPVSTTVTVNNLTPNTAYAMRVRARDTNNVLSGPSATANFTTASLSTCAVTYSVSDWGNGSGFTGNVTVANTGASPITGWTLRFTFPAGQRVVQGWNATWAQPTASADVSATNLDWNATIQPGASVSIGFSGTHTGTNPSPATFTLNSATC